MLMLIPEGNIAVLIPLNPQNNTLKTRQLTRKKEGLHMHHADPNFAFLTY